MRAAGSFRGPGGVALLATLAMAMLSAPAAACPVCGAGAQDRNNLAFLISTIFLSLTPLAAAGAGIWWLRGRARQVEREEFAARALPADPAG